MDIHPEQIERLERRVDLLTDLVALAVGGLYARGALSDEAGNAAFDRVEAFGRLYASDQERSRQIRKYLSGRG